MIEKIKQKLAKLIVDDCWERYDTMMQVYEILDEVNK